MSMSSTILVTLDCNSEKRAVLGPTEKGRHIQTLLTTWTPFTSKLNVSEPARVFRGMGKTNQTLAAQIQSIKSCSRLTFGGQGLVTVIDSGAQGLRGLNTWSIYCSSCCESFGSGPQELILGVLQAQQPYLFEAIDLPRRNNLLLVATAPSSLTKKTRPQDFARMSRGR